MNHLPKPSALIFDQEVFSETLFEKLKVIQPALERLEIYEFRYALQNLTPAHGLGECATCFERRNRTTNRRSLHFYSSIQLKPKSNGKVILDPKVVNLSQMLFVGLVLGEYQADWINRTFILMCVVFIFSTAPIIFPGR